MPMKIKIIEIRGPFVTFRSDLGDGYAKWSGEKPHLNSNYNVEIDIDDKFVWGQNIATTDATATITKDDNYNIIAVAEVIAYEKDGCLSLKLNESVILLEVEGVPDNVTGNVKLRAVDVTLFPVNL